MPVISSCERCSAPIRHKPSRARRFCSRACKEEDQRYLPDAEARACAYCGGTFTPIRKRAGARFCSKVCSGRGIPEPGKGHPAIIAEAQRRAEAVRGTGTKGYVKRNGRHEHRTIAEEKLGRQLLPGEVVHHIDGDKHNNDPANLAVMHQREHMRLHGLGIPGVPPHRFRGEQ